MPDAKTQHESIAFPGMLLQLLQLAVSQDQALLVAGTFGVGV